MTTTSTHTTPATIPAASAARRAALIGRRVTVRGLADHPAGLVGTVERLDGMRAVVRFADGTWAFTGRTLHLHPAH